METVGYNCLSLNLARLMQMTKLSSFICSYHVAKKKKHYKLLSFEIRELIQMARGLPQFMHLDCKSNRKKIFGRYFSKNGSFVS